LFLVLVGENIEVKGLVVANVLGAYKYAGYVQSTDKKKMVICKSNFLFGPWTCTAGATDIDLAAYTIFT